jgi:guanylate kinase
MPQTKGRIFLIDGPSGTGKSTLLRKLLDVPEYNLVYCKRVTTRSPRPDDAGHSDYEFVSQERFSELAARHELAEYANFLFGMSYGLPRLPVEEVIESGRNALAITNLGTYEQVKAVWPDSVLILLISPVEEIEARLRARGSNTEEQIAERLDNARRALLLAPYYDYVLPNRQGKLDRTIKELGRIIKSNLRSGPDPNLSNPNLSGIR